MKNRNEKGVLTVEAALLMPIVLSTILFFLHFFRILWVEQQLYHAAFDVLQDTSACGYLFKYADTRLTAELDKYADKEYMETLGIVGEVFQAVGSNAWFTTAVERRLDNPQIVEKTVSGGIKGISFWGSDVYAEDEMAVVRMDYEIEFPVFCSILPALSFERSFLVRSFSGDGQLEMEEEEDKDDEENEEEQEGYVYVTKSGTVYHISDSCTYIKVNLVQCPFDKVGEQRNTGGGRYYPCDACAKKDGEAETVWITKTGTHYHTKRRCSKIHRDVRRITLSEAKGYRPCSKCAAEK